MEPIATYAFDDFFVLGGYFSVDICEEKFLAYFWWCFDRLKACIFGTFI